ncbi:MAG: glycosyltransferase family 2 protein, partial [Rhodothermales bacterium]|nr:glycosyltransferase family 2 protein [Rhodothermales bacterium]
MSEYPSDISPRPADTPDVSVVIVNYNVREFLAQALKSVERASAHLRVETIVVDNNSIDGSVRMLESEFPDVTVIANSENVGFGRANNIGIRRASGRHILILNPDTIVQEDTLDTLCTWLDDHPECGAVGCQILNPDGSFAPESRRSFPTPEIAFYRMTGLSRLFPRSRVFGRYNLS